MYVWQDMEISNISNYRDLKFQRDALMRVREREGGGGVVVVWGGGDGQCSDQILLQEICKQFQITHQSL